MGDRIKKVLKFKINANKFLIALLLIMTIVLASTSGYLIYYFIGLNQTSNLTKIRSKYLNSLHNDKYLTALSNSSSSKYSNKLDQANKPLDSLNIDCHWIKDEGNQNVTFGTNNLALNNAVIKWDIICEIIAKSDNSQINLVQNQFPVFFFDDFVQNFFSNEYLIKKGVDISDNYWGAFFGGHQTSYKKIVDYINSNKETAVNIATRIVKTVLSKITFLSELSLLNKITFQNKKSSSPMEKGVNGEYTSFRNLNDRNNNREIKIIVDTYTNETKPLKGDINVEPDLRFDLENALFTIVHEYAHHLTLYSQNITKKTFLSFFKKLFSNAKFGLSKNKKNVFGSWKEFQTLYEYANDMNSHVNKSEIIDIFRRLYGMHKYNKKSSSFYDTVSEPDTFEHQLEYWWVNNPTKKIKQNVISNKEHSIQSKYPRRSMDINTEGAQKIDSMLKNTKFKYIYKNHVAANNNKIDIELNCGNEFFYFYGLSYDYEAFIGKNSNRYTDDYLLSTIKYYFSFEELMARIVSVITFQYTSLENNDIRPHRGCGFKPSNDFFSNKINLDFDDNVRLENKLLTDYLALKRMGIDVFDHSKELMNFFISSSTIKSTQNNVIKFHPYSKTFSQQCGNNTYPFPFNTNVKLKNGDYQKRFKLIATVTLNANSLKNITNIKIANFLDTNVTIKLVPFEYLNAKYFSYKKGKHDSLTNRDFQSNSLMQNQYGVVFDIGGKGLWMEEACSLISKNSILGSTIYIDLDNNNKFNANDIKLKVAA